MTEGVDFQGDIEAYVADAGGKITDTYAPELGTGPRPARYLVALPGGKSS